MSTMPTECVVLVKTVIFHLKVTARDPFDALEGPCASLPRLPAPACILINCGVVLGIVE